MCQLNWTVHLLSLKLNCMNGLNLPETENLQGCPLYRSGFIAVKRKLLLRETRTGNLYFISVCMLREVNPAKE